MDIELELRDRSAGDGGEWRPRLFDLSRGQEREAVAVLLRAGAVAFVHDAIREQLHELIACREPARSLSPAAVEARVEQQLAGASLLEYGRWAYYPWSRRLVHVLPEAAYRALRGDRNRYKITAEEQTRLRSRTIGVVGLSVGQAAAVTLALEGVGGAFRLADFDTLGLSNMNRLRAGVQDLGVNKAVLAAREMFEIDPYLSIALFPGGIREENLDAFLAGGGNLDLLVEECDDLSLKVRLRERARELGIPVLMDTSDRGLIDVERFDREPDRPLFHGLAGALRADAMKDLEAADKVGLVLRILGGPNLSTRAAASLAEVKETLVTWPQLASAVALGGALITDVARRLLLGTFTSSGRFYVDPEAIVCDGADAAPAEPPPGEDETSPAAFAPPRRPARPDLGTRGGVSAQEVRYLVAHGILAPSGGNCQPWRFEWRGGRLLGFHDVGRSSSLLDFEHGAAYLAFGAAAENMGLAARALGLQARIEPFPEAGNRRLVCALTFRRDGPAQAPDLLEQVYWRVTNRRLGERRPLDEADRQALQQAAPAPGARLQFLEGAEPLEKIGTILGAGDRLRALSEALSAETFAEIRWTPREVENTRDGLDVATLGLPPAGRALLGVLARAPVRDFLRRLGAGRALGGGARRAVAAAAAVGLLTVEGVGPSSYFQGGRAVQRLWLTATARGLAFQPMTALPYLFARLERGGGAGLTGDERRQLGELRGRYRELFEVPPGSGEVMLFRVAHAGPPAVRSLRRPLEDVLSIDGSVTDVPTSD
jgi:molybdopterin/thiamine biosynthesis adenylyltransferase/nitroreductase